MCVCVCVTVDAFEMRGEFNVAEKQFGATQLTKNTNNNDVNAFRAHTTYHTHSNSIENVRRQCTPNGDDNKYIKFTEAAIRCVFRMDLCVFVCVSLSLYIHGM